MSERTCETCKHSNPTVYNQKPYCEKMNIWTPAYGLGFGCNFHTPRPPSRRERIAEAIRQWDQTYDRAMYETIADRILEIVNE